MNFQSSQPWSNLHRSIFCITEDQDWGYAKSGVLLLLKDLLGNVVASVNIWGTYRSNSYQHGTKPPEVVFTDQDDIVALAKPGYTYVVAYKVGGGGGHSIEVEDLCCTISYENSCATEPSEVVTWDPMEVRRNLAQGLLEPDEGQRYFAVSALCEYDHCDQALQAVPWLIQALEDPSDMVKQGAAEVLGKLGHQAAPAAVPLTRMLRDDNHHVRWEAALALANINPGAVELVMPVLLEALQQHHRIFRCKAAAGLGNLGSAARRAVPQLIRAAQDREDIVRYAAANALREIRWGNSWGWGAGGFSYGARPDLSICGISETSVVGTEVSSHESWARMGQHAVNMPNFKRVAEPFHSMS